MPRGNAPLKSSSRSKSFLGSHTPLFEPSQTITKDNKAVRHDMDDGEQEKRDFIEASSASPYRGLMDKVMTATGITR